MSRQKKPPNNLESASPALDDGKERGKSRRLKPQAISEDLTSTISSDSKEKNKSKLLLTLASQPPLNEMTCKDKLAFYQSAIQTQNLYQKLEAGLILDAESFFPFWTEYSSEIAKLLWLPIKTGCVVSDSNLLSTSVKSLNASSWFLNKIHSANMKNSCRISCPSSTVSVLGYTASENTNPLSRKTYKTIKHKSTKPTPNSVMKIRLYPDKALHKLWKSWLAAYRFVYNWAICKLCADFQGDLQKACREDQEIPEWVQNTLPGHQKQEACDEAYRAYQQAKVAKGKPKFRSCRATSQTIQFKVGNFKNGTWYPRTTKSLVFTSKQNIPQQCVYGTELVYCRGEWFGCFPQVVAETETNSDKVIALDPGNRCFLTGYDGENILEFAKEDIGRLTRLCLHLDKLISEMVKSPSKRYRYKLRKATHKLRTRIKNLVKELQNKIANFLTENYKLIFLPTYETSKMVLKTARKIKRKSVRNMLTFSHSSFANHLMQQAKRKNVIVVRCNEAYTSKTCGVCGTVHQKLGGAKVHKCPNCSTEINRDWGGARNIMLRALQATAFTVKSDVILIQDLVSNN